MKLFIDTSDRDNKVIKIGDHQRGFDGDLLLEIDSLLNEIGKDVHDITEIEVNKGPGSFTSLRIGVAVTNALNYALGLKEETITPVYGSPPNITTTHNK